MTGSPDSRLSTAGASFRRALCSFAALRLLPRRRRPAPTPPGHRRPAERIVALSPHLTELAFAAGAGPKLVGVVEFSDHPAEARALPRIGDAFRLDLEALAAASPDLVLGWPSGNSPAALDRLRRLGYRVVELEPRHAGRSRAADRGDWRARRHRGDGPGRCGCLAGWTCGAARPVSHGPPGAGVLPGCAPAPHHREPASISSARPSSLRWAEHLCRCAGP